MEKQIEARINDINASREIRLEGKISLRLDGNGVISVGKAHVRGLIEITRSDVVIDGSNAEIQLDVEDSTTSDWGLFYIRPKASNVRFRNLNVRIWIKNPEHSNRMFVAFYNTAYGTSIENCRVEILSDKQLNLACIYNNGNTDTHMETRADNLSVTSCVFKARCRAEEYPKEVAVWGLINNLANSLNISGNFIEMANIGYGGGQKAVGVYNNGRFCRFIGNNIKANGTYNEGKEREHAYAYGMINEGLFSLITSNNIVGEWAGKSVGLENSGSYAVVSANKILATHTINGRSVRMTGENNVLENNVLVSTSRNARLVELSGSHCMIGRNVMEVLMAPEECRSGCGICAAGENCRENIISENLIKNVLDCGIFADASVGMVANNQVFPATGGAARAGRENGAMLAKLDERNIQSII